MKSNIDQLAVVYLGRSGGGVTFFESVYLDLNVFGDVLGVFATDSEVRLQTSSKLIQVRTPHSVFTLLFDPRWLISSINLTSRIHRLGISDVVFLMPQPIDYIISILLRLRKIRVSYVIHDPKHHQGEFWPLHSSIKARFRISHKVFFLSSFVANHFKYRDLSKKSVITKLEARRHSVSKSSDFTNQYGNYFLNVGRMKSYKGLERLLLVWNEIGDQENYLLIAGAGIQKSLHGKNIPKNVYQIDRWLTEAEIWGLIENSKGLILLYEEATQSGVAAIALNLGIPVLSTNVGGLKEQLEGVANAVVVENNISDIKQGIREFGKHERIMKNNLEMNSPMEISLKIFEELCERN